jgi:hypothetical protein
MPANLANVQWLSIAELADMWANEIDVSWHLMVRELRFGLYKFENAKTNAEFVCGKPLSRQPSEDELPSINEPLLYREFMLAFCEQQRWAPPRFWLHVHEAPRPRGRPPKMNAIVQELRRRADRGELEETGLKQARVLHSWAKIELARESVPAERTIYNQIRREFSSLKHARHENI